MSKIDCEKIHLYFIRYGTITDTKLITLSFFHNCIKSKVLSQYPILVTQLVAYHYHETSDQTQEQTENTIIETEILVLYSMM